MDPVATERYYEMVVDREAFKSTITEYLEDYNESHDVRMPLMMSARESHTFHFQTSTSRSRWYPISKESSY